jgi:predicted ATPase/class 3 adenylate cyclase
MPAGVVLMLGGDGPAAKRLLMTAGSQRPSSVDANPLPTGTVTFLFTDIEGSTQRWEASRDAMAGVLARHDALMRASITAHGGNVFKTVGDEFCAAFATAAAAVSAAIDAQRALLAEDFSVVGGVRVRMALHTGTANERDGDYFGSTVNRLARLLAICNGGQVLVSKTTSDLLQGNLPPDVGLRDLGNHRLKDLARPEHVYQLVAADLPKIFPALRSLGEFPNNLPPQLTSFVGREHDVAEIKMLLQHNRLVTLVGSAGAGKTRCAIQTGAALLDDLSDGVWLVELAPISDSSLVTSATLQALGVQEVSNYSLLETLLAYLKRMRLLLLFDNCEHVIDEARSVANAILRACPEVRLLATSRERLNIAGEQVFRVPSLGVPAIGEVATTKSASSYGAVALFTDRAFASDGRFELTDANAPYVTEICRRLDGIPLAIELAAAWVKVLSPQQLAQRLGERFRVLTGGDRSALPRHQTMLALIDWSYDLLSERERMMFRKLSIFAGGFTLETAAAVCSDETLDEMTVLGLLSSLVDKSLVQSEFVNDEARYRLLESMRSYAHEKMAPHGELESMARAHAAAYLKLAQRLDAAWENTPDAEWKKRAEPELENWRAALQWTFGASGDSTVGQRLAAALRPTWFTMAPSEGRSWIRAGLETVNSATSAETSAKLAISDAHLAMLAQQYEAALPQAERALGLFTQLKDRQGIALANMFAGAARGLQGETIEGIALLQTALNEFRTLGSPRAVGATLSYLGVLQLSLGHVAAARTFFGEALKLLKAVGASRPAAHLALYLAEAEFQDGNALQAVQLADEALVAERALNDLDSITFVLCSLAAYLVSLDKWDEAAVRAREALSLSLDRKIAAATVLALQHLAAISALRTSDVSAAAFNNCCRAARLSGFVDARIAELKIRRDLSDQAEHERTAAALNRALGAHAAYLQDEGRQWNEARAVEEAFLI